MPSLMHLADEILLDILAYLELDNPTLSSVCRTSSRLNGLARPILYRSICFNLPPHDPIRQLTQTLDEDDELAPRVHRLALTWRKDGYVPTDDRVNFQNLIHKLTSLRYLTVAVALDQRSSLSFLEFAEYKELRRVAFNYADLTNSMIMKFMFLPKIERMDILFLKSLSNPSIPLDCHLGTSSLKVLNLGPCTPREVVLGTFLQCPAALESLTFTVPPFAEQFQTAVTTRIFSPRQVGDALMHVKHSLVRLAVYWRSSNRNDGSRLDLSSFEKLKFVSLPSPLFFNLAYPHGSRDGVYQVLPKSLEALEVMFPEPHWIFKFPIFSTVENDGPLTRDNWMMELALKKPVSYPSLSRVTLKEVAKDKGYILPGSKMADVSEWVQKACDEMGIQLRVWTR